MRAERLAAPAWMPTGRSRQSPAWSWLIACLVAVAGLLATAHPLRAQTQQAWPQEIASDTLTVKVYEPEFDSLEGNELTGRAAVSVAAGRGGEPSFGAVLLQARVRIDQARGAIVVESLSVTEATFPDLDERRSNAARRLVESWGSSGGVAFAYDSVMAALGTGDRGTQRALNTTPPKIVVTRAPSALILIDGDPVLRQVPNSPLMTVINTPYMIVFDPDRQRYYLSSGIAWYSSADVLSGWAPEPSPPQRVRELLQAESEVARPQVEPIPADVRIIVATEPTELIVLTGEPQYVPLVGGALLAVKNTEADLLLDTRNHAYYVLISGRWFTAPSLDGPWTYRAPDELPPEFARIPADSEYGHLLASVAGSAQATRAVLDATVPHTAAVSKSKAKLTVQYDGEPRFRDAGAPGVSYAVNTSTEVLSVDGRYYAVDDGVWFVAPAPYGPWVVATYVPTVIYTIPPYSPVYNVTCVRIYEVWGDIVYVGYTPCYTGTYVYAGTVVYGTGYYYEPWVTPAYYFPRPYTYGLLMSFNPRRGGWFVGYRFGAPFLSIGIAWGSACDCLVGGIYGPWWLYGGYYAWPRPYSAIDALLGFTQGIAVRNNRIVVNPVAFASSFRPAALNRRAPAQAAVRATGLPSSNLYQRPQNKGRVVNLPGGMQGGPAVKQQQRTGPGQTLQGGPAMRQQQKKTGPGQTLQGGPAVKQQQKKTGPGQTLQGGPAIKQQQKTGPGQALQGSPAMKQQQKTGPGQTLQGGPAMKQQQKKTGPGQTLQGGPAKSKQQKAGPAKQPQNAGPSVGPRFQQKQSNVAPQRQFKAAPAPQRQQHYAAPPQRQKSAPAPRQAQQQSPQKQQGPKQQQGPMFRRQ